MVDAVLFDLDGVIRIYREADTRAIEEAFGLPSGCVNTAAFRRELFRRVTTGVISRREWVEAVGDAIGCSEAAEEWGRTPGRVDHDLIAIVKAIRAQGLLACLITNGTDNLRKELRDLGLLEMFDDIFNSAELGYTKPAPEIFRIAINTLRLPADRIAYVDDTEAFVEAAKVFGINSTQYTNAHSLHEWMRNLGINLPGDLARDE